MSEKEVWLITGAGRGLGVELAKAALDAGHAVVATARQASSIADALGEHEDLLAVPLDVTDPASAESAIQATVERFGRLDVLVNNAAIVPFVPWDEVDYVEWRRIMSVNLDGTFLACLYAQRPMRKAGYGRIVNIGSNVFLAGTPNLAHYVASKGGVIAFTRALAREVGPHGITVNAVAPGLTETEGVMAGRHAEAFEFVQTLQCLPRRGLAEDIAPSVAFLASEEAGWVTGQLLVADAGMTHN
jgi:3-oxoacyl-[acyl-carrier protein] reductase/pyridoxal 4-dehydrogenase